MNRQSYADSSIMLRSSWEMAEALGDGMLKPIAMVARLQEILSLKIQGEMALACELTEQFTIKYPEMAAKLIEDDRSSFGCRP